MGKPGMIINYANVQKHLHNIKRCIFTSLVCSMPICVILCWIKCALTQVWVARTLYIEFAPKFLHPQRYLCSSTKYAIIFGKHNTTTKKSHVDFWLTKLTLKLGVCTHHLISRLWAHYWEFAPHIWGAD